MSSMITELVLATRNRHKGEELTALLSNLGIRVRTLAEFPDAPEVTEDGDTCEANAVKKARTIADVTGLPAVADDTGLEVDALSGRPGVFAARYAGEHVSYENNWRKLLKELAGIPRNRRQARFLTVAALALPGGDIEVAQGTLEGSSQRSRPGPAGSAMIRYFTCRNSARRWLSFLRNRRIVLVIELKPLRRFVRCWRNEW